MLLKELTPEESLKTLQNRTPTQSINTTSKPKIVYSTPPKEGLLPKITNTIKGITTLIGLVKILKKIKCYKI